MKALIAMSGGVDSSVAAKLIKDRGFDCIGCTMKLYHNEDAGIPRSHTCCSLDDVQDAESVAYKLGIPYYVFNFSYDFKRKVIDKFVDSYMRGITPNPCIDCNRYMKFEKLFQRAQLLNCDYVVTGHYARIEKDRETGLFLLKKALDETKDQSYVLYNMNQEQLSHALFPLGGLRKSETRRIAEESGFVNAGKPDSQDICFVPDGDYASVIELHAGQTPASGDFIDKCGNVLVRHKGIIHYTIGQRKGLGLAFGEPMYVCRISAEDNTITLGKEKDLYSRVLTAGDFNWISGESPDGEIRCKVKTRYRHPEQWASVTALDGETVRIVFDEPQRALTPGQAAVLYDGEIVLGGGTIISC